MAPFVGRPFQYAHPTNAADTAPPKRATLQRRARYKIPARIANNARPVLAFQTETCFWMRRDAIRVSPRKDVDREAADWLEHPNTTAEAVPLSL